MNIDELDLFIIWEIYNSNKENKPTNTWEMSLKYAKINDIPHGYNLSLVYKRITTRLEKFCKLNLFSYKINGEGKKEYEMNLNSITIKKHRFPKDGLKYALVMRI